MKYMDGMGMHVNTMEKHDYHRTIRRRHGHYGLHTWDVVAQDRLHDWGVLKSWEVA